MKERVTISVSSVRGSRQYHLSKRFQQGLRGVAIGIGLVTVTVGISLYYLSHQVDFAKLRQRQLESESLSLSDELSALKSLKAELELDLDERENRLSHVSERLGDIESMLGVDLTNETPLESRLDVAAITGAVRTMMLRELPSGPPVRNARISSGYGKRVHPVTGKTTTHRGIDYAVNTGTPVYAPADGVVESVRPSNKGSGNFLRLQHSCGFSSSYSHLKSFKVKSGEFVRKGAVIAYSGNSGLSSGPHLHYEVRFVGRALDPRAFADWDLDGFESIFEKEKGIRWEFLVNRVEQRLSPHLQLSSQPAAQSPESSS